MAEFPTSKNPAPKVVKPKVMPTAKSAAKPAVDTKKPTTPATKPAAVVTPSLSKASVAAKPPLAPPAPPVAAATPVITPPVAPSPAITTTRAAPIAAAVPQKETKMNDTITKATETFTATAHSATERATAMFGDVNTRAKDAMAKGTKAIEELVEFSKGNMEAVVASGRVAAKGAEEIAKYSAEYGRSTIEKANATAKQFAAVKSPTEFFQLQGDVAKQTLDALVHEGSKFTENYLKLLGEITQPLSNRYAVAAEKVKSTVAA